MIRNLILALVVAIVPSMSYAQCANGKCSKPVAAFMVEGAPIRNALVAPVVVAAKVAKVPVVVGAKVVKGAAIVTGRTLKAVAQVPRAVVKVTTAPVKYVVKNKPIRHRMRAWRRCRR